MAQSSVYLKIGILFRNHISIEHIHKLLLIFFRYGLLGPSGCGKTTLLRCIVGRLQVDSGNIIVLGNRPGARGHEVPGSLVGYMPQVIFLIGVNHLYHRLLRSLIQTWLMHLSGLKDSFI